MSIKHIEDFAVSDFIDIVENLQKYEATEKLDGANLSFGFDNEGKFFTSRESKHSSSNRIYDAKEYPDIGSSNTFRSAHLALESVSDVLKTVVGNNQLIEIEVLFGKQPNAITYGNNDRSYIAFLRGLKGTSNDVVTKLTTELQGKTTKLSVTVLTSTDGVELDHVQQEVEFEFVGPQQIDLSVVATDPELKNLVNPLNDFLVEDAKDLPDGVGKLSNGDLAAVNLTSIKTEFREDIKYKREVINAHIRRTYMLPIKQFLLSKLVHTKSKLTPVNIDASQDVGIEGVVLRDPDSGNLVKLVDRNRFTAVNAFNHVTRRVIGGMVKTTDTEAALESRGGIMGHMMISIATLIGEPEMARASQMRRIMDGYNSDGNPVNTVKAFAEVHKPSDFQAFKRKALAVINQARDDLNVALDRYNKQKSEYKLHFSDGKVISITPEIDTRTYLAFAEARRDLNDMEKALSSSGHFVVVIASLYRRALHTADDEAVNVVSESTTLFERKYDTDPTRYINKDAWALLNIYFATVFLSVMMYKANDRIGLRFLRDKTNFRMERWSKEMSPLNFWGYPIWRCATPAVKKHIGNKNSKALQKVVRRIPPAWFKFLHMDFSFGRDVPINWVDHYKTLKVLQQYPGMNVERVNIIMKGVFSFENLTYDQKVKVLNQLYYYIQQFIPYSPLFIRFKAIYHDVVNGPKDDNMLISEIMKPDIKETADATATTSASANSIPFPTFGDKQRPNVIKRKRNKDLKFLKFTKPAECPIK